MTTLPLIAASIAVLVLAALASKGLGDWLDTLEDDARGRKRPGNDQTGGDA